MKIYDWILIVCLVLLSNLVTLWVAKKYIYQEIKVVNVEKLIDDNSLILKKAYLEGRIDKEQLEKFHQQFIEALTENINQKTGIIVPKQIIIGGNVEDITENIKREITK